MRTRSPFSCGTPVGRDSLRHPQCRFQPSTAFGQVATGVPEVSDGGAGGLRGPTWPTAPRGRLVNSVLEVQSTRGARVADRRGPGPRDSPTWKLVPADCRLRAAVGL